MPRQRNRRDFFVARAAPRLLAGLELADAILWSSSVLHCVRLEGRNNAFRVTRPGDPRWALFRQNDLANMVHVHPPMALPSDDQQ